MNFKERIINGLYGQAVADSCGNPFEFKNDIDPDSVIAYANRTDRLVISDDTQMAMFGFEAMKAVGNTKPDYLIGESVNDEFTKAYIDWFRTQTESAWNAKIFKDSLLSFNSMWSIQAPGNTCLSALKTLKKGGVVKNNSMGCGSVMRLLPLVMLLDEKYNLTFDHAVVLATISGSITHKHVQNDVAIIQYMIAANEILQDRPVSVVVDADSIEEIGGGWIAPEAVEMAIWAYSRAESFDDLLALSIAHDGDSDSVGAIAGSLWGLSGREVPRKYIDKLDALDAIDWVVAGL